MTTLTKILQKPWNKFIMGNITFENSISQKSIHSNKPYPPQISKEHFYIIPQ